MRVGVLCLEEVWREEMAEFLLPSVSHERRQRIQKMARWEDRLRSLAGERLLSHMLSGYLSATAQAYPNASGGNPAAENTPLRFCYTPLGKPSLQDFPFVPFSISHSDVWVACVMAEGPVGIDIQRYAGFREGVSRRCFTPSEQQYLFAAADREKAFYQLWSLKEGFVKMLGRGLAFPFEKVEFLPGRQPEEQAAFTDFSVWPQEGSGGGSSMPPSAARAYETGADFSLAVCAKLPQVFPDRPEWYRLSADGVIFPVDSHSAHR